MNRFLAIHSPPDGFPTTAALAANRTGHPLQTTWLPILKQRGRATSG